MLCCATAGLGLKNQLDEHGYCTGEQEFLDAQRVANAIDIPLKRVSFEKEYWNLVFRYKVYPNYWA